MRPSLHRSLFPVEPFACADIVSSRTPLSSANAALIFAQPFFLGPGIMVSFRSSDRARLQPRAGISPMLPMRVAKARLKRARKVKNHPLRVKAADPAERPYRAAAQAVDVLERLVRIPGHEKTDLGFGARAIGFRRGAEWIPGLRVFGRGAAGQQCSQRDQASSPVRQRSLH